MINKEYEGEDYAIALQRAIEHHCREREISQDIEKLCPYHTNMLNSFRSKLKKESTPKEASENSVDVYFYLHGRKHAIAFRKDGKFSSPRCVETTSSLIQEIKNQNKNHKENATKNKIQIDGTWYVREDILLTTNETLRIEGVEPIYSNEMPKLKLVFYMPSVKFNVGDEIVIHNLTKLRKLRK